MGYIGLDYGFGHSNVDARAGIRYGVIAQGSVDADVLSELESVYAGPNCPYCGTDAIAIGDDRLADVDTDADDWTQEEHECTDYACLACKRTFGSESAYGDEPIGYRSTDPQYTIDSCLDSDLFVLRSPYYTRACYCSPCVPGAGNLDSPDPDGIRTYCLGPDWFESNQAPYAVWTVDGDRLVQDWPNAETTTTTSDTTIAR